MSTLQDFTTKEQELKNQLAQLAQEKIQAAENEKNEKLGLITIYENEAQGYRNQASKADNEADKQRLFRFAIRADNDANALRLELGLVSEQESQASTNDRHQREHLKVIRQVNGLFIKAAFAFVAYLLADFSSARLELGFICFVLKSLAQVSWWLSVVFGGVWVVCSTLFSFVSDYGFAGIRDDFKSLTPGVRLGILAALFAAILHFLNAIVSNAI